MENEAQKQEIEKINQMCHCEMAKLWRFAPAGHPYFDGDLPYYAVFKKRFDALGGMTVAMSKSLGWVDN